MTFQTTWILSLLAYLLACALAGLAIPQRDNMVAKSSWTSLLLDNRGRCSLNRLQVIAWTGLILATFLAIAINVGLAQASNIDNELLVLIGISGTSATLAGAIKDNKNTLGADQIAGIQGFHESFGVRPDATKVVAPRFLQMILEEEGAGADKIVNVAKFQNLILLVTFCVVYVVIVLQPAQEPKYPNFGQQVAWLSGISYGSYLGQKATPKSTKP
ncbi:hypothetical protein FF011L_35230 [Roseimaritima multifibrata]|uniref:Uncharacterized protein n=1 Tax=Roseimaritima multifibrata TaxID=1930274 RepID=A0A517MIL8_9BACT|nr:hypothetical protein [Roseimaritima multifibrata]QDS94742.1 hypothetical protein FF011L_35230 [Roseimaritima multifibrata]